MKPFLIILGIAAGIIFFIFLLSFIFFIITFYSPPRAKNSRKEYPLPPGSVYKPFYDSMRNWIDTLRATPSTEVTVKSFDGLTLYGRFYEYAPDAPIEIMIHGYRATAERDLCAGVLRAHSQGRSVLLVDQRASGKSDGHVISFGVNESRDCLTWINMLIERFGPNVKIILTGISMGAATVMITAGTDLPPNVVAVLADCGYTSAKEIISTVIRLLHLPPKPLYPLVKLGARVFGRFDPEALSPIDAMRQCCVPVMFVHGEADGFVPCKMSIQNFEACTSAHKHLLTVPGAGHGLSYPVAPDQYIKELEDFLSPLLKISTN